MKEKLAKLINVKSIVTIVLTMVFSYLAVTAVVTSDQFLTVFVTVIAFYFGTQSKKTEVQDEI